VRHELVEFSVDDDLAEAAADFVANLAREQINAVGRFRFAVSGGRTPLPMFEKLATRDLAWDRVDLYQVDERIVAQDDAARNLIDLRATLGAARPSLKAMPVDLSDIDAAADFYAARLPARFDLVHLGLGADGHTASLVPGDPVLEEVNRLVAITNVYQGHRRMTLTYRALARADQILWLVAGADKRGALRRLRDGDQSIPAGRVEAQQSLIMADQLAVDS
jgi:6-phosphogluconolactonase